MNECVVTDVTIDREESHGLPGLMSCKATIVFDGEPDIESLQARGGRMRLVPADSTTTAWNVHATPRQGDRVSLVEPCEYFSMEDGCCYTAEEIKERDRRRATRSAMFWSVTWKFAALAAWIVAWWIFSRSV